MSTQAAELEQALADLHLSIHTIRELREQLSDLADAGIEDVDSFAHGRRCIHCDFAWHREQDPLHASDCPLKAALKLLERTYAYGFPVTGDGGK